MSSAIAETQGKLSGCYMRITFEFANEPIRNAFYNEFLPVMNNITHFILRRKGTKTVECHYIGG
jgi:hypothetical protein